MILPASRSLVRRNDETPGGTAAAISAIIRSEMIPGPLGMSETRPRADAPERIASHASCRSEMQQILTLGLEVASIEIHSGPGPNIGENRARISGATSAAPADFRSLLVPRPEGRGYRCLGLGSRSL